MGCELLLTLSGDRSRRLVTNAQGEALSPQVAVGRYYITKVQQQSLGGVVHVSGGNDFQNVEVRPGQTAEVRFGERRTTVEVSFSPSPAPGWQLRADSGDRVESLAPRPDGTFLVRKNAQQTVVLTLTGPGDLQVRQAVLPADFEETTLALRLPQAQVQGVLQRGEEPAAGESLELISAAGRFTARAQTDGAGGFQIPYVAPGAYILKVQNQPVRSIEVPEGGAVEVGSLSLPAKP
jgi:hypothetical protein